MYKIYEKCPIFKNETLTLRLISDEDTLELMNCYSDKKAVSYFNSDNCGGDTFYYTTPERMKKAIDMWKWSYNTKQFVRMTIIVNNTNKKIGTIEMFNRGVAPYYGVHGILRIDIMSEYETANIIQSLLQIVNKHFYKEFGVEWIVTKAISSANERIKALIETGYIPMEKFNLKDYYGRCEQSTD